VKTETWLLLGGLVVGVAGIGVTVWQVSENKKLAATTPRAPALATVSGSAPVVTPSPVPVAAPPVANVTPDTAIILAQQEALRLQLANQEKAAAEVKRLAEIRKFEDSIAATENLMLLDLAEIQAIENNDAGLVDFEQTAFNALWKTTEAQQAVKDCNQKQWAACDRQFWGYIFHWQLSNDNCPKTQTYCEQQEADYGRKNPASVYWDIARNKTDPRGGYALLQQDKQQRKTPALARLAAREQNYQGMVAELKLKYGVTYTPQNTQVHLVAQTANTVAPTPSPTPSYKPMAKAAWEK
jgi:hypothetical protein